MAGKHTYYCFGCGIEKKLVNHWFLVWFMTPVGTREFSMREEWDETIARADDDVLPICGHVCAHKMLDRFMAGLAAPAFPPGQEPRSSAALDTTDQSSTAQDRPSSSGSPVPGDTLQDPASSTLTVAQPQESQVDTESEVVGGTSPHCSLDQTTDPSGAVTGIS